MIRCVVCLAGIPLFLKALKKMEKEKEVEDEDEESKKEDKITEKVDV